MREALTLSWLRGSMPEQDFGEPAPIALEANRIWWVLCSIAALLWLPVFLWVGTHNHHMLLRIFPGGPVMDDLFTYHPRVDLLGKAAFYVPAEYPPLFAYPPAAAYLFKLLYASHHESRLLILLGLLLLGSVSVMIFRSLPCTLSFRRRLAYACSVIVFAYPILFALQRGNIEIILGLLSFAGILLAYAEHDLQAAVLFGIAATVKPFPLLFLGVFLRRRVAWRALALAAGVVMVITCVALYAAGPSVVLAGRGFLFGLRNIEKSRAGTNYHGGLMFDHSLFSLWKVVALAEHLQVRPLLNQYYISAGLLVLLGGWRMAKMPALNRVAFYTILVVSLAPISYEYTLVNCYGLLVLLVALPASGIQQGSSAFQVRTWSLALLLLIMLPFSAYRVAGHSIGGQIDAALLTGLLAMSLWRPWTAVHV